MVSRRVYLVPEEIKAIADEMTETDATAVYLLAYTGIRIGELLALRCSDVDFDACVVHVDRTQSVDAKGCVVETIPKGNRARTVPVPAGLIGRVNVLTAGHGDDEYLVRAQGVVVGRCVIGVIVCGIRRCARRVWMRLMDWWFIRCGIRMRRWRSKRVRT